MYFNVFILEDINRIIPGFLKECHLLKRTLIGLCCNPEFVFGIYFGLSICQSRDVMAYVLSHCLTKL